MENLNVGHDHDPCLNITSSHKTVNSSVPIFNIPEVSYDFSDATFDWSITHNDKCKSREVEPILAKINRYKGFKIIQLNCRSLVKYIDQLRLLFLDKNIHVLSFNETRLDPGVSDDEVAIPGYSILRCDRCRDGGGVALYVRDSITYEPLIVENLAEIEAIAAKVTLGTKKLVITSIYRPPSADLQYFNNMIGIMEKIVSSAYDTIFIGDFNYNILKEGSGLQKVHDICNLLQLEQLVTSPTRVSLESASCIDLLFSNIPGKHLVTDVLPVSLSDHYLVYTVLNFKVSNSPPNLVKTRYYADFNINAFLHDIKKSGKLNGNMEYAWDLFFKEFMYICDIHSPLREHRVKARANPWIDTELLKPMHQRDYLHKIAV